MITSPSHNVLFLDILSHVFLIFTEQVYTVTIVSNPAGVPVNDMPNAYEYPILRSITLTCVVEPLPSVNVTYQWNTGECYSNVHYNEGIVGCFAHNQTTQTITDDDLTAEDAGTISCTAKVDGVNFFSSAYVLNISG